MFKHIALDFGMPSWACHSELGAVFAPKSFVVTAIPNVKIRPAMIPILQQKVQLTQQPDVTPKSSSDWHVKFDNLKLSTT